MDEKKQKAILFNPKDEEELRTADAALKMFVDFYNLIEDLKNGDILPIPEDENVSINFYADIINAINENRNIKEIINKVDIKKSAEILYSFIVGFCIDADEAKVVSLLERARALIGDRKPELESNINVDYRVDNIEDMEVFRDEFHRLYEKGRIDGFLRVLMK